MQRYLSLLFFCTLILFACKKDVPASKPSSQPKKPVETALPPYTATLDSLIKEGGGPCKTGSDCMKIAIHWPVIHGGSKKNRNLINESIQQAVVELVDYNNPDQKEINKVLSQVADEMLEGYKLEYEESEAFGMGWANEVESETEFHHNIAAIKLFNYTFLGGAHPNYYTRYLNYDLSTGTVIEFNDFVKDSTALKPILIKKFEADITEKVGEDVSIDDFFWDSGFQFPNNFTLKKDHVEFLYNPYEAAAYAYGEIALEVPYTALKDIVNLDLLKK